jgi:hypothetical protein
MEAEIQWYSVSMLAIRWGFSENKVSRLLETFRGRKGFMDFGQGDRKRKRKYAIIRIHPTLLKEIENGGF